MTNKGALLNDFTIENNIDILALTETWLASDDMDKTVINDITPSGYVFKHVPRHGRGGGVALMFRKCLKLRKNPIQKFTSFEYIDMSTKTCTYPLRIIVLYRPPLSNNEVFFSEFGLFLEQLAADPCKMILTGDFNFHIDNTSNIAAKNFLQILQCFGYKQHVDTATHKHNHTLDLIITRSDDNIISNMIISDPCISDHYAVFCKILMAKPPLAKKEISYRNLKEIDFPRFRSQLANSNLLDEPNPMTPIDSLVGKYEAVLTSLLDNHAPVKTKTITLRPVTPWFTHEIKEQKSIRRRLERRWRKTNLAADKELFSQQCSLVNQLISSAKTVYYTKMINDSGSDQRALFKSVNKLFHGNRDYLYPSCDSVELLANQFADYFENKISVIRNDLSLKYASLVNPLPDLPFPQCDTKLCCFVSITDDQLSALIGKTYFKSCIIDPIPAQILRECWSDLLPVITRMVNTSLTDAVLPMSLKIASLHPRLKKSHMDSEEFSSFRPISNLKFISKSIEKVVADQTRNYINENNLDELYQSAYKKHHSTETALLKVQNDILRAMDNKKSAILLLLDLSAAFDTVDHNILLSRLSSRFGIVDKALAWFKSYLSDRKLTVNISGVNSSERYLMSGVPQGSVLGPLLFSLYTAPLGDLLRLHQMDYHLYADDTQLYITFNSSSPDDLEMATSRIEACVRDIDAWMCWNKLKLNSDKTELLYLNAQHHPQAPLNSISVCDEIICPSSPVRNIGVLMDSSLTMEQYVTSICKSCFYHLRNISRLRKYLNLQSTKTLVHALISTRLDFCNSALYGLPKYLIDRLQRVQNAAARVVTFSRKFDHITPILIDLHWLPVEKRIIFKVLLITFKALHGIAPAYISDLINLYIPERNLRSSNSNRLAVPRYKLRTCGYRAFSCAAPLLWNALPSNIRFADSLCSFKSQLKTYLFIEAFSEHL